jgi:hypothetical protein
MAAAPLTVPRLLAKDDVVLITVDSCRERSNFTGCYGKVFGFANANGKWVVKVRMPYYPYTSYVPFERDELTFIGSGA